MVSIYPWGNEYSYEFLRATGTPALTPGVAPSMAGFQSGIPVLAWSTIGGAYFQFLDLLGNLDPDPFFSRVALTTAPGVTNLQVADALAAYGAVWMEGSTIKLRGVAQEQGLVGQEVVVATNATSVSLAAYSFDTTVTDPLDPTLTVAASGVTVGWVSGGQVFVQRYQLVNDATGHPAGFVAAGIDGQVDASALHAENDSVPPSDAAISLGDGRDVKVQNTHLGDTLVVWVDQDNQVRGRLYPPNGVVVESDNALNGLTQIEYDGVNELLENLGSIPANAKPQVMELGPGDFAVVWQDVTGGLQIRVFALPPDTAAGDGLPDGWSFYSTSIAASGLEGFTGEFALTGFGEDNSNLAITYTASDGSGTGVFARVVDMSAIDGTQTSISVSDAVLVNTETAGNQSLSGVTGLISDRFMVSYVDANGVIQSRILDTRSPGQLIIGDQIVDRNANNVLDAGDRVRSRPDIVVGTNGSDVIIADLVNPNVAGVRYDAAAGDEDEIYGGMGNDVIFGGGGFDILDGGLDLATNGRPDPDPGFAGATSKAFTDTAIYQGSFVNYNVFINGDGSYSILDARFDDGATIIDELDDGTLNLDGWDIISNFETLQFVNGDQAYLRNASYAANLVAAKAALATGTSSHTFIDTDIFYKLKTQDQRLTGNVTEDGTADTDPAGIETVLTPVGWDLSDASKAANGFAVAATTAAEVKPLVVPTIEGFLTSWEVPVTATATAAILNMQVYDALGEPILVDGSTSSVIVVTANALTGSAAITGTGVGTSAVWIDATTGNVVLRNYDLGNLPIGGEVIVNTGPATGAAVDVSIGAQSIDGGTPGEQIAVAWVDAAGNLFAQRLGFPVDPVTALELPAVALGKDGDDDVPDADDVPFLVARNASQPSVTGLHDGQTAITYVTRDAAGDDFINFYVLDPDGREVTPSATNPTVLQSIKAAGDIASAPALVGAGEGDIFVGWTETNGGSITAKMAIYRITKGWGSPEIITLDVPSDATNVSFAVAGEDAISVVVTWQEAGGDIVGQRYEYGGELVSGSLVGITVGEVFTVATGTTKGYTGAAGLLDGRIATIYGTAAFDVSARIFDTRDATDPVIGRNAGGPRDFEVGTIFDDIIDTRDREDTIYGALGNDILIGGINDDSLYGGGGNDDLIGGTGNDVLEGNDGNDLLMGGYGRDIISGESGNDTLSYRGEARAVTVDLEAGTVRSDANVNGVVLPDPATTIAFFTADGQQILNPTPEQAAILNAIYNDAGLEDLLGRLIERNHELEIFEFDNKHGIENIEGGLGNDTLLGNSAANTISGGGGNDVIDGRGGNDTVVIAGASTAFSVMRTSANTIVIVQGPSSSLTAPRTTISNVEFIEFSNGRFQVTGPQLVSLTNGVTSLAITSQNHAPTGALTLSGAAGAGSAITLTAVDTLADQDGIVTGSRSVSWLSSSTSTGPYTGTGTTGTQFTPTSAGAAYYRAQASYQDPFGTTTVSSVNTAFVGRDALSDTVSSDQAQIIFTRGGNDTIQGFNTGSSVDGGEGTDTLTLAATSAALNSATDTQLRSVEIISAAAAAAAVTINLANQTDGFQIIGSNAADTITGSSGADTLDGGAGADTLQGLGGNDTYVVNAAGDTIVEAANGGTDTVLSSVTVTLAANVENLTLTGTAKLDGTGNALNNVLIGNTNENRLTGGAGDDRLDGGAGADRLTGGTGNDTYVIDNANDRLEENANEGIDTVESFITHTLAANFETLILQGTGDINGTGNAGANVITGNSFANTLNGGAGNDRINGGLGSDTITLGAGNDTIVFNTALGANNIDRVTDYSVQFDTIELSRAIFQNVDLNTAWFASINANQALPGPAKIYYTSGNGGLFYDSDGQGGQVAVQFATLQSGLTGMSASEFIFV